MFILKLQLCWMEVFTQISLLEPLGQKAEPYLCEQQFLSQSKITPATFLRTFFSVRTKSLGCNFTANILQRRLKPVACCSFLWDLCVHGMPSVFLDSQETFPSELSPPECYRSSTGVVLRMTGPASVTPQTEMSTEPQPWLWGLILYSASFM